VATTSIQWQKGADGKTTWTIGKKEAKPELVSAVVNPLVTAARLSKQPSLPAER
jgi:hypothetical protein